MVPILYAVLALVCAAVIGIILNRTIRITQTVDIETGHSFSVLLICSIIFCFFDSLWGFLGSGIFPVKRIFFIISSYLFHSLASVTVFFWYRFTLAYLGKKYSERKFFKLFPFIVLGIELFLVIQNIFTDTIFYVDENLVYFTGKYRKYLFILQFFNFLFMLIVTFFEFIKEDSEEEKNYLKIAIVYSFIPVLTQLFQFIFPDIPVYSVGFMLSCLIIYSFVITYETTKLIRTVEISKAQLKYQESIKRSYSIISSLAGFYDLVALVDVIKDSITLFNVSGVFEKYCSKADKEILPEKFDSMLKEIIPEEDFDDFLKNTSREESMEILRSGQLYITEFRAKTENGIHHFLINFVIDKDNSDIVLIGIKNNEREHMIKKHLESQKSYITNLETQKEIAEKIAYTDGLTGLFNKITFIERVEAYIHKNTSQNCALIFFDMDHFKSVNDILGHDKGDIALKEMSTKLKSMFRSNELIGRMGGDEFCVFLPVVSTSIVEQRLKQMNENLKAMYTDSNVIIKTSVSIGCVFSDTDKLSYFDMFTAADKVMYEVKNNGRDGYAIKHI